MFTDQQIDITEQRLIQVKKLAQKHGVAEIVVATVISDVKRAEFLDSVQEMADTILSMASSRPVFEVAPDEEIEVTDAGEIKSKKK